LGSVSRRLSDDLEPDAEKDALLARGEWRGLGVGRVAA
jgi:hypothetical protein